MTGLLAEFANYAMWVLTPIQRYSAMRQLDTRVDTSFMTNKWFILFGWSLIAVLVVLLIVIRRFRLEKERQVMEECFVDLARRCHLNPQEEEILEAIFLRSGLKKKDAIFTESAAFDEGLAKLMQDSFASGHNLAQRKRLNVMAYGIKTKLGFQKSISEFGISSLSNRNMSSRQIPVGKTVLVSQDGDDGSKFQADVIASNHYELTLLPKVPLETLPGRRVLVQYKIGEITWEFSSMVISCGPQGLELSHTDHIRFVNRRRFQRALVQKKARIARFNVIQDVASSEVPPLELFDAEVTEIAGPGLRIRSDLNVGLRDRIIVVFELEPGKWVQDIAEVRGFRSLPDGRFLIVELVGLNEQGVNDLIRVTNAVAGDVNKSFTEEVAEGEAIDAEQRV